MSPVTDATLSAFQSTQQGHFCHMAESMKVDSETCNEGRPSKYRQLKLHTQLKAFHNFMFACAGHTEAVDIILPGGTLKFSRCNMLRMW